MVDGLRLRDEEDSATSDRARHISLKERPSGDEDAGTSVKYVYPASQIKAFGSKRELLPWTSDKFVWGKEDCVCMLCFTRIRSPFKLHVDVAMARISSVVEEDESAHIV